MIDSISGNSVNSMMETIRAYQQKAAGGVDQLKIQAPQVQDLQAPKVELPNFTESVKNLLDKVNETQACRNPPWRLKRPCRSATKCCGRMKKS